MKSKAKHVESVISLDIGSTFTKAALFEVHEDQLELHRSVRVPTTADSLQQGVRRVIEELDCLDPQTQRPAYPVHFSSSAKGGLHVIAVGIVPDLTLNVAKLTALSAGARITRSYGYKLTSQHIREIETLNPDIILFSGGTDGGNEVYVQHNAEMLSTLTIRPQIIYAGNHVLCDEVTDLLSAFPVHVASNILPELDRPCVQEARDKICDVFLKAIVSGKGLDEVVDWIGKPPLPTPLVMMKLTEAIHRNCDQWTEFCMIDLGGATTDFYSSCVDHQADSGVIYRGIPEPETKRTVEGDLGVRISAPSVLIAGSEGLQNDKTTEELLSLMDYVHKITQQTGHLPQTPEHRFYDRTLAEICMLQAVKRHVGTRRRVFNAHGESFVQTGKNLYPVKKMILTGGFFSSLTKQEVKVRPLPSLQTINKAAAEQAYLVPQNVDYYQDENYVLPLLGNLVRFYPKEVCQTAISSLVLLQSNCHQSMESTC